MKTTVDFVLNIVEELTPPESQPHYLMLKIAQSERFHIDQKLSRFSTGYYTKARRRIFEVDARNYLRAAPLPPTPILFCGRPSWNSYDLANASCIFLFFI